MGSEGIGTSTSRQSIAVIGVGAIGASIAAALDSAAEVFLCRRGTGEPMEVQRAGTQRRITAEVWSRPKQAKHVDWVVLATKAQDVSTAAAWLDMTVGPNTIVVVAQNGVDHARRVLRWVEPERVVPMAVFVAANRLSRNLVRTTQATELVVPVSAAASQFKLLVDETIPVRIASDFDGISWEKLILNAALNSVTALADRPVGVITEPLPRLLVEAALEEGVAVAAARGIELRGSTRDMMNHLLQLPTEAVPSMLADRRNGRVTERAFLTGTLVEAGRLADVATPTLAALDLLLRDSASSLHDTEFLARADANHQN